MWRWQLKNLHSKKLTAWSRLLILSACAHLCCMFVILFVYKGESFHLDLTFNARNLAHATIVLLPFQKKVLQSARSLPNAAYAPAAQTAHTAEKKDAESTTAAEHKEPERKKVSKTVQPATRMVSAPKRALKTKNKKKKGAQKKRTVEKAQAVEKIVEPKKGEENKPTHKEQPDVPKETVPASSTATAQAVASHDQNIVFVGQADLDALAMQQAIQEEIGTHFKPPAGLASGLQCHVTLLINYEGAVTNVAVTQSSKVPIFDIAARNAVSKLVLPAWAHGKEITITFNN